MRPASLQNERSFNDWVTMALESFSKSTVFGSVKKEFKIKSFVLLKFLTCNDILMICYFKIPPKHFNGLSGKSGKVYIPLIAV